MGGRWSPWQRAKNAVIRCLLVALLALADRLPARTLIPLGRLAGRLTALAAPKLRARALAAARRVFPEPVARQVARACFACAGESLATTLLLRRPGVCTEELLDVPEESRRLLQRAGGAVVVSAHLGPFELIAPALAALGLRTAIVVRESYDPKLDDLVDAHRRARGVTVIHRGDPGAGARIVRALRAGALVGLLPDLPARVASVPVDFLGARRRLPVGPARVAARAGTPLLSCWLAPRRDRTGFSLQVRAIERAGTGPPGTTQRVMAALEEAIRAQPEWWPWMALDSA
jgi:KDO2-lipid IV(A) lauroyltransferase